MIATVLQCQPSDHRLDVEMDGTLPEKLQGATPKAAPGFSSHIESGKGPLPTCSETQAGLPIADVVAAQLAPSTERLRSANTVAELQAALASSLAWTCFDSFAIWHCDNLDEDDRLVCMHSPRALLSRHFCSGRDAAKPVKTFGRTQFCPFGWSEMGPLDATQCRLMAEMRAAGFNAAIAVPLHILRGGIFLAYYLTSAPDIGLARFRPMLFFLTSQFHGRYWQLQKDAESSRYALTARERDVLTWVARGKSTWDISIILQISENTVNFHLKNAEVKLNVSGRTMAVCRAIALDLIFPHAPNLSAPP